MALARGGAAEPRVDRAHAAAAVHEHGRGVRPHAVEDRERRGGLLLVHRPADQRRVARAVVRQVVAHRGPLCHGVVAVLEGEPEDR